MSYQPPPQNYGPPQVPPPWVARWDDRDQRWFFVNEQTGERTWQHPGQGYGGQGYGAPPAYGGTPNYSGGPPPGYGGQSYGGQNYGGGPGYQAQAGYYDGPSEEKHHEKEKGSKGHGLMYGALGAAAGVAGGALLMHEGEKIKEDWDEDKYRIENSVANGVQDVEDFPEDAARWTGRKVQEVEDIPQDIENKFDDAVEDVEDIPDDVAGWVGNKVGDVERFGDNIEDAYDEGRDEARYDDDGGDDGDW